MTRREREKRRNIINRIGKKKRKKAKFLLLMSFSSNIIRSMKCSQPTSRHTYIKYRACKGACTWYRLRIDEYINNKKKSDVAVARSRPVISSRWALSGQTIP